MNEKWKYQMEIVVLSSKVEKKGECNHITKLKKNDDENEDDEDGKRSRRRSKRSTKKKQEKKKREKWEIEIRSQIPNPKYAIPFVYMRITTSISQLFFPLGPRAPFPLW